jgi:hypothetical protein
MVAPNLQVILHRLETAEEEIKALRDREQAMEQRLEERDRQRAVEEQRRLLAGIAALGSVVMALLGIIWSFRGTIFKGNAP